MIIENRPQNGHQHPSVHVLPGVGSGVAAVENKDGRQLAPLWRVDCYASTCQSYGGEFYVVPIFQSRYRSHAHHCLSDERSIRTLVCDRVQPGCRYGDVKHAGRRTLSKVFLELKYRQGPSGAHTCTTNNLKNIRLFVCASTGAVPLVQTSCSPTK